MATATRRLGLLTARSLRLMTDTATIQRKITSQDASGGEVDTVVTLGPFPCRLEAVPFRSMERVEGGRLVAQSTWTAYLPHGTALLPADELVISGATYEVTDHDDPATDAPNLRVFLRLLH